MDSLKCRTSTFNLPQNFKDFFLSLMKIFVFVKELKTVVTVRMRLAAQKGHLSF